MHSKSQEPDNVTFLPLELCVFSCITGLGRPRPLLTWDTDSQPTTIFRFSYRLFKFGGNGRRTSNDTGRGGICRGQTSAKPIGKWSLVGFSGYFPTNLFLHPFLGNARKPPAIYNEPSASARTIPADAELPRGTTFDGWKQQQ